MQIRKPSPMSLIARAAVITGVCLFTACTGAAAPPAPPEPIYLQPQAAAMAKVPAPIRGVVQFNAVSVGHRTRAAAVWARLAIDRTGGPDPSGWRGDATLLVSGDVPVTKDGGVKFQFDRASFAPPPDESGLPVVHLGAIVLYDDENENGRLDIASLLDSSSPDRILAASEEPFFVTLDGGAESRWQGLAPGLHLLTGPKPWHAPSPCGEAPEGLIELPLSSTITLDVLGRAVLPPVLCELPLGELDCTPGLTDEYICNADGSGYTTMRLVNRGTLCEQPLACKVQICDGQGLPPCRR